MSKSYVLVVDDESQVRGVMSRALREAGYRVAEVESGEEALALARTIAFDAIVTDSHMPGLGGAELLHQFRQEWPAMPILRDFGEPRPGAARAGSSAAPSEALLGRWISPDGRATPHARRAD